MIKLKIKLYKENKYVGFGLKKVNCNRFNMYQDLQTSKKKEESNNN